MATKKPIKKPTKKPTTAKRTSKPVKKTAYKATTKKSVARKVVAKRATKPVTKRTVAKKPTVKRTVTRKPTVRTISSKKTNKAKLNKQGLVFIGLGLVAAIFLGVFILPNILKSFTKDKPVLGYKVSIPNNAKIPHSSFKDKNFYACVIGNLNNSKINNKTNRTFSHKATDAELKALTTLNCHNKFDAPETLKISNTVGLEKMPNLTTFSLTHHNLSSINLTNQSKLTDLNLSDNNLSSINLTNQSKLTDLNLSDNNLSSINLANQKQLNTLYLSNNKFTSINLANQTKLTELYLSRNNKLTSINLTNQKNLRSLYLDGNNLSSINLTNQSKLYYAVLSNNNLTSINLANQTQLEHLYLDHNKLTSVNLTNLKKLQTGVVHIDKNPFSPRKVRMLTSNYTYSGDNINVNTTNRATILNNIFRFASDIDIKKYIVTASGSKVTSGDYKDGDKLVVEALGIKEERPIAVTSNPGKITSAQWVERIGDRQATARLKFKSNMGQDWYNLVCYTTDGKKVVDNINMASTAKSDGYRYSNARYITYMKKCYLSGVVWSNGKNVWGPATLIK